MHEPSRTWPRVRDVATHLALDDLVTPSAHHQVLRELVAGAAIAPGDRVAEVGCQSGRLLRHLRPLLPGRRARYVGVHHSRAGLRSARQVAASSAIEDYVELVESASSSATPLRSGSCEVVFVDFWLCRLDACDRRALLVDVGRALGPAGRLLIAEPAADYDAAAIVAASIERDQTLRHLGWARRHWSQVAGYGLLRRLEAREEALLRADLCHGYTEESLRAELEGAGLAVSWVRPIGERGALIARAQRSQDDAGR